MGQIEDLRLFVLVVENGSISKAADKLRIAKSAVSRRLALLEERFGTKLIDRKPGVWGVTEAGRELYQRATRVVGDVDEIEDDFVNASADLTGPLSISVPREFGIAYLKNTLIAFKERHPEIQLTVDFDDRTVDLARENYDFAIRIRPESKGENSELRIGTVQHGLYASQRYLDAHSEPRTFDDLRQHQLLYFGTARRAAWDFLTDKGKPQPLEFQPFLNTNSGIFLLEATLNGLGIGRLPDFITSDALAAGDLVPVLPDLALPKAGIYLVHAEDRRLNRRMRFVPRHFAPAFPVNNLRVVEQVVNKYRAITPTPDLGAGKDIVVNENRAMINFKFQWVPVAVIDKVTGHPRILSAPVQPYTARPAPCRTDPADVIVPDNGIDGEMKLYPANLGTAVLLPVSDVLNKIAFNDAPDTSVGPNDTGLAAFLDSIVANYMMPKGIDIGKVAVIPVMLLRCADTNTNILNIRYGAILDDPAIPEAGAHSAFLEHIRRCPV